MPFILPYLSFTLSFPFLPSAAPPPLVTSLGSAVSSNIGAGGGTAVEIEVL